MMHKLYTALIAALLISSTALALDVAFENDSRLPLVYINLAVKTGSISDPASQEGLTNFMGKMLLRGSRKHTKEQIDSLLDQMGANLDVETRAESLILRGSSLSSQLNPFLDLLTEIVTQPNFPDSEIKQLKDQTISLLQEELGHDSKLAFQNFNTFLFRDHPYAKPILGRKRDIESLTRSEVIAHYHRIFQDRNLLMVGYGDATLDLISDYMGKLGKKLPNQESDGLTAFDLSPPESPEQRRLLIVDKPDRSQTQILIGQIGIRMSDKDFFPLHLGNHAVGGSSFSATLMQEIRVKRGWSYGAYSLFRFGTQPRSWQMYLAPASKDTPEALALTLKIAEDLRTKGISKEQFEFSKRSLVNNANFNYNTPEKRVENTLIERTLNLPDGFIRSFGPELDKLGLEQVNASLNTFLSPDRFSIVVLCTAKDLKSPLSKAAGVPEDEITLRLYTEQ